MPPELYQDLEQRPGQDLDERSRESRSQVGISPLLTATPLCSMVSGWPVRPLKSLCLKSVTLSPGPIEIRWWGAPHSQMFGCWLSASSSGGGTYHMPWVPWMEGMFQSDVHKGWQPLPQQQGLPLYYTLGLGGWRFQVPAGGLGGNQVNFRCSDFQAHQFKAQIKDGSIGFPDSESLGIGGPKVNFFLLGDDAFPLMLWLMRPYSSHSMDLKETVFKYRIM